MLLAEHIKTGVGITTRDYCGNYVYRNDTLERVMTDVGYIDGATGGRRYFVRDYRGDVRAVIDHGGQALEYDAYYPFGMTMHPPTGAGSVQPYKYTGKELDRENGLDTYDFEARCYDPALATTWQQDPLADKYTHLSPYSWCADNPIRNTDPSGMEPVYDMNGNFINVTSEGYEGAVLIYTGSDDIVPSEYTAEELLALTLTAQLDDVCDILDETALSNIYTNVVSHFEGTRVFRKVFRMNTITNQRIAVDRNLIGSNGYPPNWSTYFSDKNNGIMTIVGSGQLSYENTVENIVCSVIAHEWYGHGMKKVSSDEKNHHMAYKYSMEHPLWENTTEKYKKRTQYLYNAYLEKETGRKFK